MTIIMHFLQNLLLSKKLFKQDKSIYIVNFLFNSRREKICTKNFKKRVLFFISTLKHFLIASRFQ